MGSSHSFNVRRSVHLSSGDWHILVRPSRCQTPRQAWTLVSQDRWSASRRRAHYTMPRAWMKSAEREGQHISEQNACFVDLFTLLKGNMWPFLMTVYLIILQLHQSLCFSHMIYSRIRRLKEKSLWKFFVCFCFTYKNFFWKYGLFTMASLWCYAKIHNFNADTLELHLNHSVRRHGVVISC